VEDGIPYAIDFMNPAPDADLHSVGKESFDWIVDKVAKLAVQKAQNPIKPELRWASLLGSGASKAKSPTRPSTTKPAAKKIAATKSIKKAQE
jgi:hypothetical protein